MRLRWITEGDDIYSPDLDAYADWIAETCRSEEERYWRLFVLRVPPVRNRAAEFLELLDTGIGQVNKAEIRFNAHDMFHWAYCALLDRTKPTEMILLERGRGDGAALGRLSDTLNAALDIPEGDGAFEVLLGHGSTLPVPMTPENHNAALLKAVGVYLADLEADQNEKGEMQAGDSVPAPDAPLVVTAIIDHGIPFLNDRFCDGDNRTRFAGCWRQGAETTEGPAANVFDGNPDPTMGQHISRDAINAALEAIGSKEIPTEQSIYTDGAFRAFDGTAAARGRGGVPLALSATHGGQMLDVAAGARQCDLFGAQNPILAVELPARLVAQTNGFLHEPYVKSALNWIWYELTFNTDLQSNRRSVVVNYSFGDFAGRRDGQAVLDADFQLRLDRGEVDIINLPAGNGFLNDCHAQLKHDDIACTEHLELWVQPDTKTASFVQIWLNERYDSLPFDFRVTAPSGEQSPVAQVGASLDLLADDAVARVYVQNKTPKHPLPSGMKPVERTCITLAIRPTAAYSMHNCTAPAGRWQLEFAQNIEPFPKDELVNIYVERNDSVVGFSVMGRQAYLDHPNHSRILPDSGRDDESLDTASLIKRTGTTGANTNARDVFVAAAFRGAREPAKPAPYSSAGPQGNPTAAFIAEDSAARRNIIASGTASSTASFAGGTSAGAALATRTAVEVLLRNPDNVGKPDAREFVKAQFIAGAHPAAPAPASDTRRQGRAIIPPSHRDRPSRLDS